MDASRSDGHTDLSLSGKARVFHSYKIEDITGITGSDEYIQVLDKIAKNVKMGPFQTTSGISLPYYLNSSTNFLDKHTAPHILKLVINVLNSYVKPQYYQEGDENIVIIGMEAAGGMMVSQLGCLGNEELNSWAVFCYMRKDKKTTGTCQQLEGPNFLTSRNSESSLLKAIWVDDALSTGSSLKLGAETLKSDYNIEVVFALYLVDRSTDRSDKVPNSKQTLAHHLFRKLKIGAIYDLVDVDKFHGVETTTKES